MRRTVVLNVVGLTPRLLGPWTPSLSAFAARSARATVAPSLPAVTCTVQATYLTGTPPSEHGIVGNGWYFRDECEVHFWRQSNHLIQRPKIWERLRALNPSFTCANLFWWYNMYSTADYSITPRPMYPADGRKIPDIYTQPADLREPLQATLGRFPLFDYWGPTASLASSRWIAESAKWVEEHRHPTLTLIYLPHLDYGLQRLGPDSPAIADELRAIDAVCGDLIDFYERQGAQVIVLSEYGITSVTRPVDINRALRRAGLLVVREEMGREQLDAGASVAFAVVDHQLAHVYVNDPARLEEVRAVIGAVPGVEAVYDAEGKRAIGLDHPRAGDLVALAAPDAWFTYYFWLDDARAPDYARTVDIHRKPGYDPAELFLDPALHLPRLRIGLTLLKKRAGLRTLLEVVPLDGAHVRGSHGRAPACAEDAPVFITPQRDLLSSTSIEATEVCDLIQAHVLAGERNLSEIAAIP